MSQGAKAKQTIVIADLVKSSDRMNTISHRKVLQEDSKNSVEDVLQSTKSLAEQVKKRRSSYLNNKQKPPNIRNYSCDPTSRKDRQLQNAFNVTQRSVSSNPKYQKKSWKELKEDLLSEFQMK